MLKSSLSPSIRKLPISRLALSALLLLVLVAVLSWAGLLSIPHFMSKPSFLALHAAGELFAVVVAVLIFATGYHSINRHRTSGTLLLACAFLGVGVLDFLHTLSYPGMDSFFTPNTTHKAIVLWLGARLLAALGLLALVLPALNNPERPLNRRMVLFATLVVTVLCGYVGVFQPQWFPATYIQGKGLTSFKINLEWLIIFLNLVTLVVIIRHSSRVSLPLLRFLAPALVVLVASGLFFASYQHATDSINLLGHLYKVLGYLLIYRAIFVENIHQPYYQLQDAHRELARMNEERNRLHANLQEAQRIARLGSWEWEIDTGRLFWSDEVYRIFGVEPREFEASYDAFLEFVHRRDREAVTAAVDAALADPRNRYSVEHRVVRPDGAERWIHGRGEVLRSEDGVPVKMIGMVLDITERRQKEARELQADKMGALGMMAGGIAHDFNNILTPIMMHTQMVLREADKESPLAHSLTQVKRAAERAAALVRQILDFSRQGKHEPMLVKLSVIVKEAAKFLESVTPANIKLNYRINTGNDNLAADPTQILQVIMNLSLNAIHAMGDNEGLLEITLDETSVLPQADVQGGLISLPEQEGEALGAQDKIGKAKRWLKLTVRDNGEGIAPENMPRLFDPFFTTKEKGEGTGMGLPVVHGVVNRHGGRIRVESEPGRGSCFEIYLPALNGDGDGSPEAEELPLPKGKNEHILLVDDEAAVLEAAAASLSGLGYRVTTCGNPLEALELLRAKKAADFDLLLSDYSMPKIKGTELAAAAKMIRPDLPILLCTGYTSKIDESVAMALGISALLMKPLRQEVLAGEIRRVLDHKQLHLGNGFSAGSIHSGNSGNSGKSDNSDKSDKSGE